MTTLFIATITQSNIFIQIKGDNYSDRVLLEALDQLGSTARLLDADGVGRSGGAREGTGTSGKGGVVSLLLGKEQVGDTVT